MIRSLLRSKARTCISALTTLLPRDMIVMTSMPGKRRAILSGVREKALVRIRLQVRRVSARTRSGTRRVSDS